uniref:Uncharacterized protein n=1 Tax=Eutreptiella gymnastica TaxID=73025 RepID=A0A7S1HZ63_9EUGL|mmetsp:Transcript_115295/g.200748  ORF Transcript_115295/g.200748 Transcript_115295/m.200748 type:complete len:169 (+) Transcript_115295:696-1202(+)
MQTIACLPLYKTIPDVRHLVYLTPHICSRKLMMGWNHSDGGWGGKHERQSSCSATVICDPAEQVSFILMVVPINYWPLHGAPYYTSAPALADLHNMSVARRKRTLMQGFLANAIPATICRPEQLEPEHLESVGGGRTPPTVGGREQEGNHQAQCALYAHNDRRDQLCQ